MTVAKFLNEKQYNDEFYTVQELYDDLADLVSRGLGNRIVMVDERDERRCADYRFLKKERKGIDTIDTTRKCVYLYTHDDEIDDYLAEKIF